MCFVSRVIFPHKSQHGFSHSFFSHQFSSDVLRVSTKPGYHFTSGRGIVQDYQELLMACQWLHTNPVPLHLFKYYIIKLYFNAFFLNHFLIKKKDFYCVKESANFWAGFPFFNIGMLWRICSQKLWHMKPSK